MTPGHLFGMMESMLCHLSRASPFMHCRQLSSMSESIAQRMDVALDLQQKAKRARKNILGAQYTL
jgi:hypothetical protein